MKGYVETLVTNSNTQTRSVPPSTLTFTAPNVSTDVDNMVGSPPVYSPSFAGYILEHPGSDHIPDRKSRLRASK
jgi:hypothetical protein